ncbi:MAG: ABC transporter permease [Thermoplasmatota archaeon]
MSLRRAGAVASKVLRSILRDRRTLAFSLFAPILAMFIFGYVFGAEVQNVHVAVVNEDQGTLAGQIRNAIDPSVITQVTYANWSAAEKAVKNGDVAAALDFPANFTADASGSVGPPPRAPLGAHLSLDIDGSNSQIVQAVDRTVLSAIQSTLENRTGGSSPVKLDQRYAYASGAHYIDFFVPGIMTFAALMFTTLIAILAFVSERTSGTLDRMMVAPVRPWEIVLGYAAAFGLVALLQGALLLGTALAVFHVLVAGSIALVALVVGLMALNALFLGILLSAMARRESQAIQFFPIIAFPTFLLSGIFLPIESLPPWLAQIAWLIPPTYAVEALRDVMLRGWGLEHIGWYVAALVGWAVAFLVAAMLLLRRSTVAR